MVILFLLLYFRGWEREGRGGGRDAGHSGADREEWLWKNPRGEQVGQRRVDGRGPQNLARSQNGSRNGSQNGSTKSRVGPRGSKTRFKKSRGEHRGPVSGSIALARKKTGAKQGALTCHPGFGRWGTKTGPRKGPRRGCSFLADGRGQASTRIKGVKTKNQKATREKEGEQEREKEKENESSSIGGH